MTSKKNHLGQKVVVTTRRFSRSSSDDSDQWVLEFSNGLEGRPTLRRPTPNEALRRPGTRVSVALDHKVLKEPNRAAFYPRFDDTDFGREVLYKMVMLLWGSTEQSISDDARRKIAECWPTFSNDFRHVVAGLCPTLDVTVRVKIATEDSVTVVTPGDWQTLKPEHLLNRLYKGSRLKVPDTLLDLRDTSGVLLGRIGYAGSFRHAILIHGGLRSATVPNLAGVVLGHNNLDLARNESQPMPSREAWQQWAEAWIDSAASHDVDALADLHPLCPDRDLAVYQIGSEQLNDAQLSDWLQRQSAVRVFEGRPDYEDFDDVSKDNFDRDFRPNADILFLPTTRGDLAKSLAFPSINYTRRLEKALRMTWGEFEESEDDDVCVGDVDGIDITRPVTCYVRLARS
jgi:hypothetical protein